MYKLFFTAVVLIPLFSVAQLDKLSTSAPATTITEYNYVTNGYIDVATKGFDAKRGYYISDIVNGANSNGSFNTHRVDVKGLFLEETKQLKATIIILYVNNQIAKVLCLPTIASDMALFQMFLTQVATLSDFDKGVLISSLSYAYAKVVNIADTH